MANQPRPNDFEKDHDRDTAGSNAGEFQKMPKEPKPTSPAPAK